MQKQYHHLSLVERENITEMLWKGETISHIAKALNRDKSTISRELHHNASPIYQCYMPHRAQKRVETRRKQTRQHIPLKNSKIQSYVVTKLKEDRSPEIIAGRIPIDYPDLSISHDAIYQYIYHSNTPNRHELINCLRRAHRIRRKKNGRKHQKGKIPHRIDISLRPKHIETRRQFGHWEGDSLIYKRHSQSLATHTERKTRFIVAKKAKDRTAKERTSLTNCYFSQLPPEARRTMTYDNGLEFSAHEEITSAIGTEIYFARPYASWQRGSNENSNGLIRWYLPKNTDLDSLTDEELSAIIKLINDRPRKCLNWKTANEAFNEEMNKLIKQKSNNLLTNHSVALVS